MNKTAVVTGGSGGIGGRTAIELAREGYAVVINYNKSKERALELLETVRGEGYAAIAVRADVSDEREANALISKTVEEFGRIDVLVNAAGISSQRLFTETTREEWDSVFGVNVNGCFYCTRFAVKDMLKRRYGKIINVSSIWGITGASCEVHYSASKAAVIGMTKALAKELGPSGIRVNCVAPGVIDTDMNKSLDEASINALKNETPLGVIGRPEDAAGAISFLASEKADFITGQVISPNGGFVI